jgi:hypothetical protein
MSHIDTLKAYFDLKKSGLSDEQAQAQIKVFDNWLNQVLRDFVSNKTLTIIGSIIITVGGFTLAKVWDLSHDMTEMKSQLITIKDAMSNK